MNTEKVEIPVDANTEQFHAKLAEAERQFIGSVERMNYATRVSPFDKIVGSMSHLGTDWVKVANEQTQEFHRNLRALTAQVDEFSNKIGYKPTLGKGEGEFFYSPRRSLRDLQNLFVGARPQGEEVEEGGGAMKWNWRSAIIGGMLGRFFGGRYAGIGAGLGGGLGGPFGALAGGVVGAGVGGAMSVGETVMHGIEAGIQGVVNVTMQAVKSSVQLGMEYERLGATFKVFTGSAEAGTKLFADIQQMALRTPYTTQQLAGLGQVLLGYDVPPQEVPNILSRLGDIAGGDTERFHRLALAFGQVLASGRLLGQERRQFANVGVGLADFARAADMSESQFLEASRRGEIGANIIIKTLNMLTSEGGRYAGASAAVMNTVSGSWKNLMSTLEQIGAGVGMKAFERFNVAGMIGDVSNVLQYMSQNADATFGKLADWLENAAKASEPLITNLRAIGEFSFDNIGRIFDVGSWEEVSNAVKGFSEASADGFAWFVQFGEIQIRTWVELERVLERVLDQMGKFGRTFVAGGFEEWGHFFRTAFDVGTYVKDTENLDTLLQKVTEDPAEQMRLARFQIHVQNRRMENRLGIVHGFKGAELSGAGVIGPAGLVGMGVNIPVGAARIAERFGVDWSKFEKGLMDSIETGTEKGFDPLTKFQQTTTALNRLVSGGMPGVGAVFGGIGGGHLFPPMITEKQASERAFEAFQQMEDAVRSRLEVRLAPAAFAGSSEAQETVNRSMAQNVDKLNEIQMVLDEANRLHTERNEKLDRVIKELGDKQIIVKKKM